jgi:hypothetical protein
MRQVALDELRLISCALSRPGEDVALLLDARPGGGDGVPAPEGVGVAVPLPVAVPLCVTDAETVGLSDSVEDGEGVAV